MKHRDLFMTIKRYDIVIPYHAVTVILGLIAVGVRPWEWI